MYNIKNASLCNLHLYLVFGLYYYLITATEINNHNIIVMRYLSETFRKLCNRSSPNVYNVSNASVFNSLYDVLQDGGYLTRSN